MLGEEAEGFGVEDPETDETVATSRCEVAVAGGRGFRVAETRDNILVATHALHTAT